MGEKSTDFAALFCVWETAGKKKKKKRLNKIFNWSKPTKQCCQQLCDQMSQSFLPWERLRSLMKLEAWWLIVQKPLKFSRKQSESLGSHILPQKCFLLASWKNPWCLATPCSCLKWDENEAVWEGGVKSWLEVLPRTYRRGVREECALCDITNASLPELCALEYTLESGAGKEGWFYAFIVCIVIMSYDKWLTL